MITNIQPAEKLYLNPTPDDGGKINCDVTSGGAGYRKWEAAQTGSAGDEARLAPVEGQK